MSDWPTSPDATLSAARTINVAFTFDQGWQISRPGAQPAIFPPGSGLGVLDIAIGPLHLDGLDPIERQARIDRRIADLAIVSQALALAFLQLSDAVG